MLKYNKLCDISLFFIPPSCDMPWKYRFTCGLLTILCFLLLITAVRLNPDPNGFGTHQQLGIHACGFYERTGWPCPTCGMTTSFSYLVKGHMVMAFYVQPAGAILAILTFLVSLFFFDAAISGASWHEKMATFPFGSFIVWVGLVLMIGWLWRCAIIYWRM